MEVFFQCVIARERSDCGNLSAPNQIAAVAALPRNDNTLQDVSTSLNGTRLRTFKTLCRMMSCGERRKFCKAQSPHQNTIRFSLSSTDWYCCEGVIEVSNSALASRKMFPSTSASPNSLTTTQSFIFRARPNQAFHQCRFALAEKTRR